MAMAQAARLNLRMQKELKLLLTDPPPGASFPTLSSGGDSSLTSIDALFQGPEGTVYSSGVFKIKIQIPERYPFQPPIVTFATPIYHPNIDNGGRICLDILNLPPKGMWQPSLNISTVLTSIGLLLTEPNPDDGLMHDASRDYKYNRQAFDQHARSMTEKYARAGITEIHTGQNTSQTKIEGSVASVCISLESPGCSNNKRDSGEEISENTVNFGKLHATPKVPVASHSTNGEIENTNVSNQCSSLQTTSVLLSLNTNHNKTDGNIRLKKRGLVESKASDKENLRCLLPQLTDNKVNDALSGGESADAFKQQSLDAVVVLDSEDSDEENVTAVRSKTFVSRKRKLVNFAKFRQLQ